jgi:hypothetical protein
MGGGRCVSIGGGALSRKKGSSAARGGENESDSESERGKLCIGFHTIIKKVLYIVMA